MSIITVWLLCGVIAWLIALTRTNNIIKAFVCAILAIFIGPGAIWVALIIDK